MKVKKKGRNEGEEEGLRGGMKGKEKVKGKVVRIICEYLNMIEHTPLITNLRLACAWIPCPYPCNV